LYGAVPSVGPTARINNCFDPSPTIQKPDVSTLSLGPVNPRVDKATSFTGAVAPSVSYTSANTMPDVAVPLGVIRTV